MTKQIKYPRALFGAMMWLALIALAAFLHPAGAFAMATAAALDTKAITDALDGLKKDVGDKLAPLSKDIVDLKAALKAEQDEKAKVIGRIEAQEAEFKKIQKAYLERGSYGGTARQRGKVTDQCARILAASFILNHARRGNLDNLAANVRDSLFTEAKSILGIETRTALTTTDVPLPSIFGQELQELITEFGVARARLQYYPIGKGTVRPARFKTRPAFGSIAISGSVTEKSPQLEYASLESHKIGGMVRVPRELEEQSMVPMGQFIARYAAIEFARAEDTWAFLADGSGTFETVKGITKIAVDNSKNRQPAGASVAEMVAADFRALRSLVNVGALGQGAAYFMHSTLESHLRTLNTAADPYFFVHNNTANRELIPQSTLDGFPIIWTDVFQAYSTSDTVNKFVCVFGVPQYWWFGEHGSPRVDYSGDVYFATDEIGARCLEEIDVDYMAVDAFASLQLAAT